MVAQVQVASTSSCSFAFPTILWGKKSCCNGSTSQPTLAALLAMPSTLVDKILRTKSFQRPFGVPLLPSANSPILLTEVEVLQPQSAFGIVPKSLF